MNDPTLSRNEGRGINHRGGRHRADFAASGGDVAGVARRHGRRIVHVHCKDVRTRILADALRRDRSFLDAVVAGVFTVPLSDVRRAWAATLPAALA